MKFWVLTSLIVIACSQSGAQALAKNQSEQDRAINVQLLASAFQINLHLTSQAPGLAQTLIPSRDCIVEVYPPDYISELKIVVKKPWAKREFETESYSFVETEISGTTVKSTTFQRSYLPKDGPTDYYARSILTLTPGHLTIQHRSNAAQAYEVTTCEIL